MAHRGGGQELQREQPAPECQGQPETSRERVATSYPSFSAQPLSIPADYHIRPQDAATLDMARSNISAVFGR